MLKRVLAFAMVVVLVFVMGLSVFADALSDSYDIMMYADVPITEPLPSTWSYVRSDNINIDSCFHYGCYHHYFILTYNKPSVLKFTVSFVDINYNDCRYDISIFYDEYSLSDSSVTIPVIKDYYLNGVLSSSSESSFTLSKSDFYNGFCYPQYVTYCKNNNGSSVLQYLDIGFSEFDSSVASISLRYMLSSVSVAGLYCFGQYQSRIQLKEAFGTFSHASVPPYPPTISYQDVFKLALSDRDYVNLINSQPIDQAPISFDDLPSIFESFVAALWSYIVTAVSWMLTSDMWLLLIPFLAFLSIIAAATLRSIARGT